MISQVPPSFVTPAGNVGTFYDGGPIAPIQIEISDPNPGDNVVISLAAGSLPPGLSLSTSGLISGYIIPLVPINQTPGFSTTPFDQYPFDFYPNSLSTNYQFTLELNDGRETSLRTFEIYVYSRSSLTADTIEFTADNTFITADGTPTRNPLILTPTGSIGRVRSDNFFAFQFEGYDPDGNQLIYVKGGETVPGLTLDPTSGWFYGYIPDQGITETDYSFTVKIGRAHV